MKLEIPLPSANEDHPSSDSAVESLSSIIDTAGALQESEERYRSLIDSIDGGFCVIELLFDSAGQAVDYRFLEINSAFERVTGLADSLHRRVRELVPDHEPHWFQIYGRVALTGEPIRFIDEAEGLASKWFDVYAWRVGPAGSHKVAALFNDITGRKKREQRSEFLIEIDQELARSGSARTIVEQFGHRLSRFMGLTRCIFTRIDDTGTAAEIFHEYKAPGLPSLLGKSAVRDWVTEEFRTEMLEGRVLAIDDILIDPRTSESAPLYLRVGTRSFAHVPYIGKGQWRFALTATFREAHEWNSSEIGFLRDLTTRIWLRLDRAEAEERTLRRNVLLSLLSESAHKLLAATDPIAMVESLFSNICGALDLDVFFNFAMNEADGRLYLEACGGVDATVREAFASLSLGQAVCGTVAQNACRMVVKDVQNCGNALADGVKGMGLKAYACHPLMVGERVIGTLSFGSRNRATFEPDELEIMQTIASYVAMAKERLRVEGELKRALVREQTANRSKDRFLAVLSHELRTPLTPVLMTATARLMQPNISDDHKAEMLMIKRNVELETKLIDDLLDLSRIVSGKLSLRLESVELSSLIEQACEVCRPQILEKGIDLRVDFGAADIPVCGDPSRLQQVIWNVVKNAVKFTPDGGRIFVTAQATPDGQARVVVRDEGMGILPAALLKIFDAFEQADSGIARQFGGLGLGLAISKALVEMHRGSISAESEGPGSGSTFTVTLPLESKPPPTSPLPVGGTQVDTPRNKFRLLITEDHADTALMLAQLLGALGHTVTTAGSVQEALEKARGQEFDLLVSDVGLPDGTGYQLMEAIRQLYRLPGVAMSGYGMDEDIRRSFVAGFSEHLVKPVDIMSLEHAIQRTALRPR